MTALVQMSRLEAPVRLERNLRYMHLKANCLKKFENGIESLVGQAVFKLWIKTVKNWF